MKNHYLSKQTVHTQDKVVIFCLIYRCLKKGEQYVGICGQRYCRRLKQPHRIKYYNLLTAGTLNQHWATVDNQAEQMFQFLVISFAKQENVTKKHKASAPTEWVQKINNIRNRVVEIVNNEVIFV